MQTTIRTTTAVLAILMLGACAKKEEAAPAPAAEVAPPAAEPLAPPADATVPPADTTAPAPDANSDDGSQSGGDKVKPPN